MLICLRCHLGVLETTQLTLDSSTPAATLPTGGSFKRKARRPFYFGLLTRLINYHWQKQTTTAVVRATHRSGYRPRPNRKANIVGLVKLSRCKCDVEAVALLNELFLMMFRKLLFCLHCHLGVLETSQFCVSISSFI